MKEMVLILLASNYKIPFVTYSSEELSAIEPVTKESLFTKKINGLTYVCERAAILGSGMGKIILPRRGCEGVDIALARRDWSVIFKEDAEV